MKLLTFADRYGAERIGALARNDSTVVDLSQAAKLLEGAAPPYFDNMLALLDEGDAAREKVSQILQSAEEAWPAEAAFPLDSVRLLSPVPRPRSIRDCMAFQKHVIQATRTIVKWKFPPAAALDRCLERWLGRGFLRAPRVWHQIPIYYKGNPHSVVGHDAEVIWPSYTEKLDFELECGVFIGRKGRDIPERQAKDYIAGYTIFNDFSARDIQLREMSGRLGPAKSKDFDTGNAIGPYLVTPDELSEELAMQATVNGCVWASGSTAQMHFSFERIIAYISQSETLYPGDFIGSGTVPGGCGLELDRWLQPGDVIELKVGGLGTLRNRVVKTEAPR
jgi:2-keto-4-pentenoate hydratase/2-oxohepta-3-ene-1,7-dioic acid hydratase in catechol pathway